MGQVIAGTYGSAKGHRELLLDVERVENCVEEECRAEDKPGQVLLPSAPSASRLKRGPDQMEDALEPAKVRYVLNAESKKGREG